MVFFDMVIIFLVSIVCTPPGVQGVGFSNLNVPIWNVHIPQIRQRLIPFGETSVKTKSTINHYTNLQFLYHEMWNPVTLL